MRTNLRCPLLPAVGQRNRGSGMRSEQSEAAEHLELLRRLRKASKNLAAGRALVHHHFSIQRRLRRQCFLAHRLCLSAALTGTRREAEGATRFSLNCLRLKVKSCLKTLR